MKQSTPINISQMKQQPKPNNSGPVDNNVTNSISNQNKPEFQRMLDKNLELTRKEKAKRGFSLSNDSIKRGPMEVPQNEPSIETTDNTEMNNDVNNNVNNVNKNNSEFQSMLDRNLALTQKEKAKRGFSLNNKNSNGKRR